MTCITRSPPLPAPARHGLDGRRSAPSAPAARRCPRCAAAGPRGAAIATVATVTAIATVAAITAVATATSVATAATLLRDAGDVGQQRHLAGVLDGLGHVGLLLGVVAGDPTGPDLGAVGHEPAQQVHVLPVDVLDTLGDEDARLLLGPAGVVLVLGAGLGGHQKGSSEGS